MLVVSPWPVYTTVSAGSVPSRPEIDCRIVGKSENDRPVAPGPPENRVSPLNTAPSSGACQHTEPGECPGVCNARYSVPAMLSADQWALAGTWKVTSEGAVLQQPHGKIVYRFNGRDLHLVLGPAKDGQAIHFKVRLDGAAPGADKGADVGTDGSGVVNEQRLYQLIRLAHPGAEHTVEIEFLDSGVEAFAFTFG